MSRSQIIDLPRPSRRWLQFSLRTVLVIVAVAAPSLAWLGYRLRQPATPDAPLVEHLTRNASHDSRCATLLQNLGLTNQGQPVQNELYGKLLFFHSHYSRSDRTCRTVFVYAPFFVGSQPETIVIADARYRLLTWKEVGGSPMFHSAAVTYGKNGAPTLSLTRYHPGGGRGTYLFSLDADQIHPIGDVVWSTDDDEDVEEMVLLFKEVEEADAKRR